MIPSKCPYCGLIGTHAADCVHPHIRKDGPGSAFPKPPSGIPDLPPVEPGQALPPKLPERPYPPPPNPSKEQVEALKKWQDEQIKKLSAMRPPPTEDEFAKAMEKWRTETAANRPPCPHCGSKNYWHDPNCPLNPFREPPKPYHEAHHGWICPRCGASLAPWVRNCSCHTQNELWK